MKPEWAAVIISSLALGVSGYAAFREFYPFDEAKAVVSSAQFNMDEGRFGLGPSLTAAISIVNSGTRPLVLTALSASFGYSEDTDSPPADCRIGEGNSWAGTPWETRIEGNGPTMALPVVISAKTAYASVYSFEANPFKDSPDQPTNKPAVCLSIETRDVDGGSHTTRVFIGVLEYSGQTLTNVSLADGYDTIVDLM